MGSQRVVMTEQLSMRKHAHTHTHNYTSIKNKMWDFPGGLVVKNPPCNAQDASSSPGQGTKIPQAKE